MILSLKKKFFPGVMLATRCEGKYEISLLINVNERSDRFGTYYYANALCNGVIVYYDHYDLLLSEVLL